MSKPTVHLVHGFNVADYGAGTIAKLAPWFEDAGFRVNVLGYRWTWLFTLRYRNPRVAARLVKAMQPGDIAIGHSNGCAIIDLAARQLEDLGAYGAAYINPALPREQPVPLSLEWLDVCYAPSDQPVRWASRLRRWTSWLPWADHPWGAMGAYGYSGDDPRVTQYNLDEHAGKPLGHSGVFTTPHVEWLGNTLATMAGFRLGAMA